MRTILLTIVLAIAALIRITAWKPDIKSTTVLQQSHTFYYYPKANVYYDVAAGNYIFLGADGKTWETGNGLSEEKKAAVGKNVVLTDPAMPVWKDNEQHRLIYSAALYASPADLKEGHAKHENGNKKEKVIPKAPTEKSVAHKSGINRFFNKLFGSKKDKGKKKGAPKK